MYGCCCRPVLLLAALVAFADLASAQIGVGPAGNNDLGQYISVGMTVRPYRYYYDAEPPPPPRTISYLERPVPELRLDAVPLQLVLDQLGETAGVNFMVLWRQLGDAGVEPATPITLRAKQLPLKTVLWLVLNQAAPDDVVLAYRASRDLLLISTQEHFSKQILVRIYDVADIVAPRIEQPEFFIGTERTFVTGLEGVVGDSVGIVRPITQTYRSGVGVRFGGRAYDPDNPFQRNQQDTSNDAFSEEGRRRKMEELIGVITTTIEPDSWDVNGGTGSIQPFRDQLIVRASPFVHQMIGGPLSEE